VARETANAIEAGAIRLTTTEAIQEAVAGHGSQGYSAQVWLSCHKAAFLESAE
jgi:hypothetical protein